NPGARLSAEGFGEIVARLGADPAIRSLLGQRADCPADIATQFKISQDEGLSGDALIEAVAKLAEKRE
ncbi:DUF2336 domain-containing protein, partial [Proteus mirabilis]|uniref:DUF2336 domain-containing protein n=1 Tax=Proteus mirabilis TaxID=584 RepID=UPI0013D0C19D